jgi:hypothetical protein
LAIVRRLKTIYAVFTNSLFTICRKAASTMWIKL